MSIDFLFAQEIAMDEKLKEQLDVVATVISKVNGLYHKWAQKHEVNYYLAKVLCALHIKDAITQKHICESFEIPKQTVNNIISSLKHDGYVTLESSTTDKREKIIKLTEGGKIYVEENMTNLYILDEKVINRIGQNLFQQLIESMTAYADALEIEMQCEV